LKSFVEIASEIAREAGASISEFARKRIGFELKGTYDLVTEADRTSERIIVERLRQHFPTHAVMAEEGGGNLVPEKHADVLLAAHHNDTPAGGHCMSHCCASRQAPSAGEASGL